VCVDVFVACECVEMERVKSWKEKVYRKERFLFGGEEETQTI